jgi:hypothetical protein
LNSERYTPHLKGRERRSAAATPIAKMHRKFRYEAFGMEVRYVLSLLNNEILDSFIEPNRELCKKPSDLDNSHSSLTLTGALYEAYLCYG